MLQDPASLQPSVFSQLRQLQAQRGWAALWHGSSASILKTVPKYVSAIWVKDIVAAWLPPPPTPHGEPGHRGEVLRRSAAKSVAAGVAGAALTNPLDVIRNEMFKTEEGMLATIRRLHAAEGISFCKRGLQRNLIAVAAPIGMTIFITDTITEFMHDREAREGEARGAAGRR